MNDGHIHASLVVAVEMNTTSVLICLSNYSCRFPKIEINRIDAIYWTTLTACLEEWRNEKNEWREYI